MKVTLHVITPDAEATIIEIARVSSSRDDKSAEPEKLINYLIKNRHWSPFEHSSITMKIVTSKAIGIQLLRHRSFTFQEFSQRYAVVENIEPVEIREQATNNRQSSTDVFNPLIESVLETDEDGIGLNEDCVSEVQELFERINLMYNRMLDKGVARECARMILPMATQTTIYMTGTVRSWVHLIQLRDDGHAQKEAQLIAKEMKKIFNQELPAISKALEWRE